MENITHNSQAQFRVNSLFPDNILAKVHSQINGFQLFSSSSIVPSDAAAAVCCLVTEEP